MKCPFCGCEESKVVDSRPTDEGERIRRRRECFNCAKRFTTYEIVETTPVMVIKRDNSREPYQRQKLTQGILRACEKRPISVDQIDSIVDQVESSIQHNYDREIPSEKIGEYTMEALKSVDEVAYVRFACVYRQFQDIHSFMDELKRLIEEK
ncbi:MAG: transcriptional regulator NrdR [Acutalibacteraceae bacterium]|nr:transcriptional repressor NrdR [Clostridia bacterium]MEE3404136.1 transcriptional regulator NrdR [Acutalibacteraceae bacterium]HCA55217.1 transcriptional regulator NrdR [Oscillospiraceae bacterium]